jgi:hypothetical protein
MPIFWTKVLTQKRFRFLNIMMAKGSKCNKSAEIQWQKEASDFTTAKGSNCCTCFLLPLQMMQTCFLLPYFYYHFFSAEVFFADYNHGNLRE